MRVTTSIVLSVLATIAAATAQASSVHVKVSNGVINGADTGIATISNDSLAGATTTTTTTTASTMIERESAELDSSDSDSESDDGDDETMDVSASKHLRQPTHHTKGYYQYCGLMTGRKLSDVKYVCSWKKSGNYNIFFERPDGTIEFECSCLEDITNTYGSVFWDHFHHSKDSDVECFSSDKREAAGLRQEFKDVSCKGTLYKTCVKKPGQDTKCKYFSQSVN